MIQEQRDAFSGISDSIESAFNIVTNKIEGFRRHPSLDAKRLLGQVNQHFNDMRELVSLAMKKYEDSAHEQEEEETFSAISKLFDKRVGPRWDPQRLESLYKRGAERFDQKRPRATKISRSRSQIDTAILLFGNS